MRATALVLALSLVAPAVGAALCEFTCSERHRDAAASQAEDCHKQQADTGAAKIARADANCRHDVEVLTSTAQADPTCRSGAHVVVFVPVVALAGDPSDHRLIVRESPITPPALPALPSTPLRI